jgi:hypothetical protein
MPDYVAHLKLDAGGYQAGMERIQRLTEEAVQSADQALARLDERLKGLADAGREIGANIAAGGKQAEDAVDSLGRHALTTGEEMERAFGRAGGEGLLGAFALLQAGAAVGEGAFAELAARAQAGGKELAAAGLPAGRQGGPGGDRGSIAYGGSVFGPAGIDAVPSWLTPGELAVSADAASHNPGLLEAMNAGEISLAPTGQRSAYGGSADFSGAPAAAAHPELVQNNNITVNPPPNTDPAEIARKIVPILEEMFRRGQFRLGS